MKRNPDPLKDSFYATVRGTRYKSCPSCSREAGKAVFYPLADFGERTLRGEALPQPYCRKCRGKYRKAG